MHAEVPTTTHPPPERPGLLTRFLDWLTVGSNRHLTCDGCGHEGSQRHFERTGVSHEFSVGSGWFRSAITEIEFRCPGCGETKLVEEVRSYAPIF